jgi:hypothetical protein
MRCQNDTLDESQAWSRLALLQNARGRNRITLIHSGVPVAVSCYSLDSAVGREPKGDMAILGGKATTRAEQDA